MHALIIEDNYILAMEVEDSLRPLGYVSFDIAPNTAAAVAAAEERCPDLIVADQRLETGTGTEAIRRICQGRFIPVVFVTGSASEVRAELPNVIIVDKPCHDAMLHSAIKQARADPYRHG